VPVIVKTPPLKLLLSSRRASSRSIVLMNAPQEGFGLCRIVSLMQFSLQFGKLWNANATLWEGADVLIDFTA
jgi:hypothetical protein